MNDRFFSHIVLLQGTLEPSMIHATVHVVDAGPIAPAESTADQASRSVLFSRSCFT